MSSSPWARIPPAQLRKRQDRPVDGRVEEVTEQGLGRARALTCSWAGKPPGPTGEGVAASQRRWQDCRKVQQLAPRQTRTVTSLPSVAGSRSRLPPSLRGRSSGVQSTRLSGERPPVRVRSSPLRGGCGVTAALEVVSLAVSVRIRSVALHADAEQRRAQQAVTLSPRAVVVRLHPSALLSGM